MCHNVFNTWPKTTLLLAVWPRDAKSLDTLGRVIRQRALIPVQPWGCVCAQGLQHAPQVISPVITGSLPLPATL